jgi:hypothetical protein
LSRPSGEWKTTGAVDVAQSRVGASVIEGGKALIAGASIGAEIATLLGPLMTQVRAVRPQQFQEW